MPKKLLLPEAAREWLGRRFGHQHANWWTGEGSWPLTLGLGSPTDKDIAEDASAVRAWAEAWQCWTGPGEVVFEERRFARVGRHRLPVGLTLPDAAAVAAAVGQSRRWQTAVDRRQCWVARWPALGGRALASRFDVLADGAEADFDRLTALLAWLEAHPSSGLWLRQIPVAGLDTKWLEKRTGLVAGLLRSLRGLGDVDDVGGAGSADNDGDFHRLLGLRKPAHRVRLRILCPALRRSTGGLGDIEAPVAELAALPLAPAAVVVVENLETGLALPDLPDTVAIMRLGHAVGVLERLPWVCSARVLYWGDIDTHGFAILDRARRAVPQLRSVLMDEATLLSHRPLWGQEPVPSPGVALEALTAEERSVCDRLRSNAWGPRVRLEQERLRWDEALRALRLALEVDEPAQVADRTVGVGVA